jgi:hypothetical protein
MARGKAFAVVGHKHWGKSKTLKALTDGDVYQRKYTIKAKQFLVRRMSNDDRPQSFYDLLKNLSPDRSPYVIMALCPTLTDKRQRALLIRLLQSFRTRYQLFFFVLRTDYYKRTRRITDDEIDLLTRFGTVKVFLDPKANPTRRAEAFKRFVAKNV